MKVGVLGIPGKWSSERFADAFGEKTGFRLLLGMDRMTADLADKRFYYDGRAIEELDALVVRKVHSTYSHHILDRLEILKDMERKGLRIISSPDALARAVNRLTCTLALRNADLPLPDTVITENPDDALDAVARFGGAIFKPLFTSKARGMQVIEDGPDARRLIEAYQAEHPILYIQRRIDLAGKDFGMVFLGGDYLGTYARVNTNGSWNTTTHFGGRYEPYEPDRELIDLAHKAQSIFGLACTSVDIALTAEGPYVFEVSAFGGFRGLSETSNIDVADLYADYVLERIRHG